MDETDSFSNDPIGPERHTTASRVALVVFAVAAGYFLWTEHRAHVVQYLPWAIFLLCPLMHVFMHGSHGSQVSHEHRVTDDREGPDR